MKEDQLEKILTQNSEESFSVEDQQPDLAKAFLKLQRIQANRINKKAGFTNWRNKVLLKKLKMWNDLVPPEQLSDTQVIFKILQKRKEEVDKEWAKFNTKKREKCIQTTSIPEPLINKLTHKESQLALKEKELELTEQWYENKLNELLEREKILLDNEVSTQMHPISRLESSEDLNKRLDGIKCSIFPELTNDIWSYLAAPEVSGDKITELRELEKHLILQQEKQHEYLKFLNSQNNQITQTKEDLSRRESLLVKMEAQKAKLDKDKQEVENKFKQLETQTQKLKSQLTACKAKQSDLESTVFSLEVSDQLIPEEELNSVKTVLKELEAIVEEDTQDHLIQQVLGTIIHNTHFLIRKNSELKDYFKCQNEVLKTKQTELENWHNSLNSESQLQQEEAKAQQALEETTLFNSNQTQLQAYKEAVVSKLKYRTQCQILEKEKEELSVKTQIQQLEKEKLDYKWNILKVKEQMFQQLEVEVTEMLKAKVSFQEIALTVQNYLNKFNSNSSEKLKTSLVQWSQVAFFNNLKKEKLAAKVAFYRWNLQKYSKRKSEFKLSKNKWIEILWIRNRYHYTQNIYPALLQNKDTFWELLEVTKQWYYRNTSIKLCNLMQTMSIKRHCLLKRSFGRLKDTMHQDYLDKIRSVYNYLDSQNFKVEKVYKDLSQNLLSKIEPYFSRANVIYKLQLKIFFKKWEGTSNQLRIRYYKTCLTEIENQLQNQRESAVSNFKQHKESQRVLSVRIWELTKLVKQLIK